MNILYINSSSVLFGAETRMLDIIQNLDKNKYKPLVLLPQPGPLQDKLERMGVVTINLDFVFQITRLPISRFIRLTKDFIHLVRKHKIDLIHANMHYGISNFWLAFLILRKPVIVHMRSYDWIHPFEKLVICRAFKAICVSNAVKRAFLQRRRSSFFMFHQPKHTEVVYDGIDVQRFAPKTPTEKIRKELNIDTQDFLVGLVGAMDHLKGQDILVKAAKIVIRKHPRTKFVMVGGLYADTPRKNEYRAEVINLIKELKLNEKIILTGFRDGIDSFMNEIDLLVQPSEREGLGTAMIEAMACGKPVIGTNIDGIPEVIGDNETGLLLQPRTPEALAEAINFFIENPEAANKLGLKGRERALKMFAAQKNTKRIQEIYQEALD